MANWRIVIVIGSILSSFLRLPQSVVKEERHLNAHLSPPDIKDFPLNGLQLTYHFIHSLTHVHEETGLLLIKPMDLIPRLEEIKEDVKEISQADILAAANIPKERAKLRKEELLAQVASAARAEQFLSGVEGTGVMSDESQGSKWKVSQSSDGGGCGGTKGATFLIGILRYSKIWRHVFRPLYLLPLYMNLTANNFLKKYF